MQAMLSLSSAAPYELAEAISEAAEQRPILDDDGRRTAALLVSVAWHESQFSNMRVGDSGHSCSAFQIWSSSSQCRALQADVALAARTARDMLAASMHSCRRLPVAERLSEFTTGKCITNRESRVRWRTAMRLVEEWP